MSDEAAQRRSFREQEDLLARIAELEAAVQHEIRMRDGLTDALRMAEDERDELFKRAEQAEAELRQAVEGWSYWLSKKSDDPLSQQVWTPEDLMKHLRAEEGSA
jgi:cell division septum initiation protein DivIVA